MAEEQSREEILAEMEQIDEDGNLPEYTEDTGESEDDDEAEESEDDDEVEDDADEEEEDSDDDDDESDDEDSEDDDELDDDDSDSDDDDTDEETEPDSVASKRIAQIQTEEKRAKQALSQEREEIAEERAELSESMEIIEQFQGLVERVKYDPISVLESLGLSEEDFEPAARQLYAMSPKGKADPKLREHAERLQQMRGQNTELDRTKAELAELREQFESRGQQAEIDRELSAYTDRITDAVSDDTPIAKAMLANNPARAQNQILEIARTLASTTGDVPTEMQVLLEFERLRGAELVDMGFDARVKKKSKKNKATKNKTKAAKKNKAAKKKLVNKDPSARPSREDVLAMDWPE